MLCVCVAASAQENHLDSTDVVIKGKTRLSLYIIGSNLTDRAYMPHLSRLKYIGIANMGRNVTFKLVAPF